MHLEYLGALIEMV